MKIHIYKIREGKVPKLLAWANNLSTILKSEALETLKEEGVSREFLGVFRLGRQNYAIGFADGKSLPSSDRKINKEHSEIMKDCLEFQSSVETAYDLLP